MDCRRVFERLSADMDGELSTADAEAVRRHILSCADCARQRRLLEKTRWAFRSIAPEPVGSAFDDGVFRRLRGGHGRTWWLSAATGLAAALGFVLLRSPARPVSMAVPPVPPLAASRAPASPAPDVQPGWSDGRVNAAADCVLSGAVVCRVETPCGDGQCSPVALVDLAGLTGANLKRLVPTK